jgi:hypothetical protein
MFPRILFPSRVITLLWLIILPSILLILVSLAYGSEYRYDLVRALATDDLVRALATGFGVVYLAAFGVYIPYHAINYVKYFKKTGAVEAAKEYQFSKKLFYVAPAIVIFFFLLRQTGVSSYFYDQLPNEQDNIVFWTFTFFLTIFTLATVILAIRFGAQYAREDFSFYLARAYYMISLQSGIGKFMYLTLALDTYNKFLKRNLKLKIKDITRIYSIFISASTEQKIKIRESIGNALEKDELELAKQLAELSSLQDKEQFLIRERAILNQNFKDILVTIIPAIISIVGLIFGRQ